MIQQTPTSKMLFGSTARGDCDRYSDRDLLLVGPRGKEFTGAVALHTSAGWSCSSYSWRALDRLCSMGGYFVEHLRREGKIIDDPDDTLAHRLATARMKVTYGREIQQAQYILGLLEFIPRTRCGVAWALDVLMVAVRSFGYSVLADRGIFVFNYSDMLNHLSGVGLLSRQASRQLATLRLWKARYRRGHYCASWDRVLSLISEADHTMQLGLHVQLTSTYDYVERAAKGHYADYGWYARTRLLEVVGSCVPGILPQSLVSRIRAPQEYASSLSSINVESWVVHALNVIESDLGACQQSNRKSNLSILHCINEAA